jgi:hypothetical protein
MDPAVLVPAGVPPGLHLADGDHDSRASVWPFWRQVVGSTVGFSGCRLTNAAPHPAQRP